MFKLIGAEDIIARGVETMASLRPVLTQQMEAQAIRNGAAMATNATLRKDEWETVDARVNDVMRERLTIADDLRGLGLVTPISIGTILRVTERISDFDAAEISFDGDTAPQKDRPAYSRNVVPVPVISKDFSVNWRQLEASRRRGDPLDVTSAGIATRKVRDKLQGLITNGYTGGPGPGDNPAGGTSIPGLTSAAKRLIVSLYHPWDESGADVIGDVLRMLETAYASNLFGPFYLYVPKNFWAILQQDYSPLKVSSTFMARILAFNEIKAVRPLDALADDNVVMVQMTEDVMDLSEAQVVTTVQWEKTPFVTQFRVLTIAAPHIKDIETSLGTSINGIIHLS